MELFPSVPEDLEAVDRDELEGTLEEFTRIGAEVRADLQRPKEDRVLIPADATPAEVTEALSAAASDRARVADALAARTEAEQTFMDTVDESLAALGVEAEASSDLAVESEEPAPDEPAPDPDEPAPSEPDIVAEPVAALAATEPEVEEEITPRRPMAIPSGPSRFEAPAVDTGNGAQVLAAKGLRGIRVNELTPLTRLDYAQAAIDLAARMGKVQHVPGGGPERFPLGSVTYKFPTEFTLSERDLNGNLDKIRAVSSEFLGASNELEVFMASGGICAPPTPFYDVPGFASRARPVRDALPSYQATRGGVSVPSVNTVDRADDGVTVIEVDEDEQGGTFATKACRIVDCATWSDTFIGIISHCLEVGNLNARTWPEGVALENDNLMAGWAATAETRLLDRIKALSINVTSTHVYNAVHDLLYAILRAKAGVRNRLRAEREARFVALMPEWIPELLVADFAAQSANEERYYATSAIEAYFDRVGVSVAWYKDSPTTGTTQNFSAETASAVDDFPDAAQIGLFLAGTFLHLDGGSLELGLVRDSTLNETNDYQLFGESFENVARIGPEQAALWLTATICPTGQFPDAASALTC